MPSLPERVCTLASTAAGRGQRRRRALRLDNKNLKPCWVFSRLLCESRNKFLFEGFLVFDITHLDALEDATPNFAPSALTRVARSQKIGDDDGDAIRAGAVLNDPADERVGHRHRLLEELAIEQIERLLQRFEPRATCADSGLKPELRQLLGCAK